jgi:hypothetical protein
MNTPLQTLVDELEKEFEKRLGGFIATQSKREQQDKDNAWFRKALSKAYIAGLEEAGRMAEKQKKAVTECRHSPSDSCDSDCASQEWDLGRNDGLTSFIADIKKITEGV